MCPSLVGEGRCEVASLPGLLLKRIPSMDRVAHSAAKQLGISVDDAARVAVARQAESHLARVVLTALKLSRCVPDAVGAPL